MLTFFVHLVIIPQLFFCLQADQALRCGYEKLKHKLALESVKGSLELPEACDWDAPFQCITVHDRKCIRSENFCDLVADCLDGSDEADCRPKSYGDFFPRFSMRLPVFKSLTYPPSHFHSFWDVHEFIRDAPIDENYRLGNPWPNNLQSYQMSPFLDFTFRNLVIIQKAYYGQPGVTAAYMIALSKAIKEEISYSDGLNSLIPLTRYLNEAVNKVILRADKYQVPYYM